MAVAPHDRFKAPGDTFADRRDGGATADLRQAPLWAVTTYFNPFREPRRLPVFREFRRRLGVPLIAVELSFDDAPELSGNDAEILIQIRGGDRLWQKERLLNLGLGALPPQAKAVAWLDCDVVFLRQDWPQAVLHELQRYAVVQPFSRLHYLASTDTPDHIGDVRLRRAEAFEAIARRFANERVPQEAYRVPGSSLRLRYAPGMAWAARRDIIAPHGLYDAGVLGGGDKLMFSAASGRHEELATAIQMSAAEWRYYRSWASEFSKLVRAQISYVDGDVLHLWHGDLDSRGYAGRYVGFERFEFDPVHDLALTAQGAWRWNSDKPELHAFVRKHLARRAGQPPC